MRKFAVLVVCLAAVSAAFAQKRILLFEFEARSIDGSVVKTVGQLLKDALNGSYEYIVVEPATGSYCYNVIAAAESAKVYSTDKALVGNVMTLGGRQFLTYQVVDATGGTVDIADKIELPPTEEYPVMADRIVVSVAQKIPYAETIEPERVTEPEVAARFKHPRKPYASVFLTAGYLYHFQQRPHAAPQVDYFSTSLVNLNMAVTFETQQMLTMLQLGLLRGNHDETDVSFDLMGNYVFGKGEVAPIAGGGIGITRYNWNDPDGSLKHNDGLNLSAGVGVLALRTYYFRILAAGYVNYTIAANDWGGVPGVKVMFGVTTPTLGPDATIKMAPGCVGAAIGGFFLTGLIIALTT